MTFTCKKCKKLIIDYLDKGYITGCECYEIDYKLPKDKLIKIIKEYEFQGKRFSNTV